MGPERADPLGALPGRARLRAVDPALEDATALEDAPAWALPWVSARTVGIVPPGYEKQECFHDGGLCRRNRTPVARSALVISSRILLTPASSSFPKYSHVTLPSSPTRTSPRSRAAGLVPGFPVSRPASGIAGCSCNERSRPGLRRGHVRGTVIDLIHAVSPFTARPHQSCLRVPSK